MDTSQRRLSVIHRHLRTKQDINHEESKSYVLAADRRNIDIEPYLMKSSNEKINKVKANSKHSNGVQPHKTSTILPIKRFIS